MDKTIGILGGMGPLAAADLFEKIIRVTQANRDQDHLHVVVESNPRIPDRVAAILQDGTDPVPEMVRSALRLEAAGCGVMVMACNTAHYFYDDVKRFVQIPFLHMPLEAASELARRGIKKAAVLGTSALIQAGVYNRPFAECGLEIAYPDRETLDQVMHMIFDGVKAGNLELDLGPLPQMLEAMMEKQGIEAFVLGCTELPILFTRPELARFPVLDPTLVLAKAAVLAAGGTLRPEI